MKKEVVLDIDFDKYMVFELRSNDKDLVVVDINESPRYHKLYDLYNNSPYGIPETEMVEITFLNLNEENKYSIGNLKDTVPYRNLHPIYIQWKPWVENKPEVQTGIF